MPVQPRRNSKGYWLPRHETLAADQADLEAQLAALQAHAGPPPAADASANKQKRQPRREPLPAHLPRVEGRIEPNTTWPPPCRQAGGEDNGPLFRPVHHSRAEGRPTASLLNRAVIPSCTRRLVGRGGLWVISLELLSLARKRGSTSKVAARLNR